MFFFFEQPLQQVLHWRKTKVTQSYNTNKMSIGHTYDALESCNVHKLFILQTLMLERYSHISVVFLFVRYVSLSLRKKRRGCEVERTYSPEPQALDCRNAPTDLFGFH